MLKMGRMKEVSIKHRCGTIDLIYMRKSVRQMINLKLENSLAPDFDA